MSSTLTVLFRSFFLNLAYVSLMAVDVHVVITCGGKVAFLCNNLFSPNLMVASAQK